MRQLEALSINGWYERERRALLMAALEFSYSRFWDSFRNNEHGIADDAAITVRVFDADYKAMKRQRGTCVPFVTRNMSAFKVTDSRMLCHPDSTDRFALYEHGMYAVLEQVALQRSQDARDQDREQWKRMHDRAIRRKALFIVFPTLHPNGMPDGLSDLLSGDHFSFFVNEGRMPLHFHMTQYVPCTDDQGDSRRRDNYMPTKFHITSDVNSLKAIIHEPGLRRDEFLRPLHSLLRAPFSPRRSEARIATSPVGGGRQTGRRRATHYAVIRDSQARSFEDLWYELPLHRIIVIGLRRDGGVDFTVTIKDRLSHPPYVLCRACAFRMEGADTQVTNDEVQATVAEAMATFRWETFMEPEEIP
jgi:hypothetical protein